MFYHISKVDLGEKPILKVKIPPSRGPSECNETPRVCFSPTVKQCLYAIVGCDGPSVYDVFTELYNRTKFINKCVVVNPTIYKTSKKLFKPKIVSDYVVTEEHWSTSDIEVRRHGYLCVESIVLGKVKVVQNTLSTFTKREVAIMHELHRPMFRNDEKIKRLEIQMAKTKSSLKQKKKVVI